MYPYVYRHAESFILRGCSRATGIWLVGGSHAINIDSLKSLRRCIVPFLLSSDPEPHLDLKLCAASSVVSEYQPAKSVPASIALRVVARVLERSSVAIGGDRPLVLMKNSGHGATVEHPITAELPRL